jgi:hypothetical protein
VPLAVVAPFLAARPGDTFLVGSPNDKPDRGRNRAVVSVLVCLVLVSAIMASATRSALVGAAVGCGALLWLARRSRTWLRRASAGALVAVVASSIWVTTSSGSALGQRLRSWHDENWLRVEYQVEASDLTVGVGEVFAVPVVLRNTGAVTWRKSGDQPTHLAYHWERVDPANTLVEFEGMRTELPIDVPPGAALEVFALARGPQAEGSYRLRWDLVEEGVSWFSDQGNPMPEQRIEVTRSAEPRPSYPEPHATRPEGAPMAPPRSALWRAALVLWRGRPLLGVGPDNFRRRYQGVIAPSPNGQPYIDTRVHANSLYFETLADLGVAGIAALAVLAVALARVARASRAGEPPLGIAGLGCAVAAGVFFVHGALDYFFEFTPLFGLFWLLLGLTAASDSARRSSGALPDSTR